jgi:TonB family protein
VRVTIDHAGTVKDARVAEGHPMLREAAVNVAQQWKFEEGAAQERVATLKFSFVILPPSSKAQGQTQSRQNPRAISKTSAILQDVSGGILRAQTTRCSG